MLNALGCKRKLKSYRLAPLHLVYDRYFFLDIGLDYIYYLNEVGMKLETLCKFVMGV